MSRYGKAHAKATRGLNSRANFHLWGKIMTLALIRHVTSLIDRGVCDAAEAARRAILYDTTQSLALYETDSFQSGTARVKLARARR